jgi:hypothetical protein
MYITMALVEEDVAAQAVFPRQKNNDGFLSAAPANTGSPLLTVFFWLLEARVTR